MPAALRKSSKKVGPRIGIAATAMYFLLFAAIGQMANAQVLEERDVAFSLATLLRSARSVVSDAQSLINDPAIGNKGFTSEYVLEETLFNYEIETGRSLDQTLPGSLHDRLARAEIAAISEIVDEWQDTINTAGIGYKGFLPATFAAQVAARFGEKAGGLAEIKLTAPSEYVRNPANRPDAWEDQVIEDELRNPNHTYGAPFYRRRTKDGRPAHRLVLPEYYMQSCLACHGGTSGDIDMTGGRKEGASFGELGGAISVVIYADE